MTPRVEDLGTNGADLLGAPVAHRHHRGGPVTEQALPTMVAIDGSDFGVSEHNSTARSTATPSGAPRR